MKIQLKKNPQSSVSRELEISSGRIKLEETLNQLGVTKYVYIENIYTDDGVQIANDVCGSIDEIYLIGETLNKINSKDIRILECVIASKDSDYLEEIISQIYNLNAYKAKVNITSNDVANIYNGNKQIDEFVDIDEKAYKYISVSELIYFGDIFSTSVTLQKDKAQERLILPNSKLGLNRILKIINATSVKDVDIILFSSIPKNICNILIKDFRETGDVKNIEIYHEFLQMNKEIFTKAHRNVDIKWHLENIVDIFEIDNVVDLSTYIKEASKINLVDKIASYKEYGKYMMKKENAYTEETASEFGKRRLIENGGLIYNNSYIEYSGHNITILSKLKELGASIDINQRLEINQIEDKALINNSQEQQIM